MCEQPECTVCTVLCVRIAEAFYMPLDAILPLFDGWRRYIYQILLKKAFVDHEIDYFLFPQHLEGLY